ncbi:MAG: hypothetical protein IBJ15_00350 [Alphaproteobacteria bacterium]|nr:hypothetical protein [Alphaproteobacteria bacterium]
MNGAPLETWRLAEDWPRGGANALRGASVYLYPGFDFGLARDDSAATGERQFSVTLDPAGAEPFFTVPTRLLMSDDETAPSPLHFGEISQSDAADCANALRALVIAAMPEATDPTRCDQPRYWIDAAERTRLTLVRRRVASIMVARLLEANRRSVDGAGDDVERLRKAIERIGGVEGLETAARAIAAEEFRKRQMSVVKAIGGALLRAQQAAIASGAPSHDESAFALASEISAILNAPAAPSFGGGR